MTKLMIRPLRSEDFEQWLPLWIEYHEADKARSDNASLIFEQLVNPETSMKGLVAILNDKAVGIAHVVYHLSTYFHGKGVAFLEDLGVTQSCRGRGIGKQLIDTCIARARENNCARFYWTTSPENKDAQKLYDRYTEAETWLRYAMSLSL